MKRKTFYILLAATLLLSLVFVLGSCGPAVPSDLDLSGISLDGKTVDYNGEVQSLAVKGTLPEGVTVEYTNNDKTDSGKYEVVAKFYYNDLYIEGADLKANLEIKKVSLAGLMYDIAFNNSKVIYDGGKHSIAVVGDIPAAVRVTYVGNGVSAIGKHTVTAKFNVDEKNYYPIADMTATITIVNATEIPEIPSNLDLSGISLADRTVTYSGDEYSLAIEGTLPAGVEVRYSNNGKTNAGEHTVVASFYYRGVYIEGADLEAVLDIEKATYDMSGISFEPAVFVDNGSAHHILVTGTLPEGVYVQYGGNGQTEVGVYTVKATFIYDTNNYNAIPPMTATLEIISGVPSVPSDLDLSGITLEGYAGDYDGQVHSLAYSGTLPEGVTVEYYNNDQTNAGTHTVTLKFYYEGLYVDGKDITADIVIAPIPVDMSGVKFNSSRVLYDGQEHSIAISGTLPEGVLGVVYEGNGQSAVGTYDVTAIFVTDVNHIQPQNMTATFTVSILPEMLEGLTFSDGKLTYDGTAKSIYVDGLDSLPEGVALMGYEGNEQVNVGTYTVTAKFSVGGVYEPTLDFTATLTIQKAIINAHANPLEATFDGEYHYIDLIWDTKIPAGVTVLEVGNGQRSIGTYTVKFMFIIDDDVKDNIEAKEPIEVTLTIKENAALIGDGIMYVKTGDSTVSVMDYNGDATAVVIPATFDIEGVTYNVTEIANYAFAGTSITSVEIPSSVLGVGIGAFKDCASLTSVTLAEGLVRISEKAFENSAIEALAIPDSVTAIGHGALRGCDKLESLTIRFFGGSDNSSNEYLGYIFGASGYMGNAQFVPESLKTLILSDACTHIPAYALRNCTSLTEIVIGSGVTEILSNAFRGCSSLTSIYIPATVTDIPAKAHNYDSPFFGMASTFTVYLGASEVPAGYAAAWNVIDDAGNTVTVVTGIATYEDYLTAKSN